MKSLEDLEKAFEKGLTEWESRIVVKHARIMGNRIVGEIKKLTPVSPSGGNLRRRWFFKANQQTGDFIIWVYNDADYAPHVNYGHRIVRAKKTVGKVKGRFMLERGIETYQEKYLKEDVEAMLSELSEAIT